MPTTKYAKPIIILVALLILPSLSSAQVTNGDFSTGDTTGWTISGSGFGIYEEGYGRVFSASYVVGTTSMSQSVDFSGYDTLNLSLRYYAAGGTSRGRVYIDSDVLYENSALTDTGWNTYSYDVSGYTGTHTLKFESYYPTTTVGRCDVYFDDVVLGVGVPTSSSSANFTLNSLNGDHACYDLELTPDFSFGSDNYDYYIVEDGKYNYFSSGCGVESLLDSGVYTSYFCAITTYSVGSHTVGIVENFTSNGVEYSRLLDSVAFTVGDEDVGNYTFGDPIVNTTVPEILPDEWFEPYEGSEAFNNISYNSTYFGFLYEGVNYVRGSVYNATEPVISFVVSPINSIATYFDQGALYIESAFSPANIYSSLYAAIFVPIFEAIPVKVLNTYTYYLAWLLVLMIFERR